MRSPSIPLFLILLLCPLCSPVDFILSEITAEFIAIVTLTLCSIFLLLRRTRFSLNVLDLLFLSFVLWYSLRMLFTASPVDGRLMIQEIGCFMLYFYGRYNRSEISFFRLLLLPLFFRRDGAFCNGSVICRPTIRSFPSPAVFTIQPYGEYFQRLAYWQALLYSSGNRKTASASYGGRYVFFAPLYRAFRLPGFLDSIGCGNLLDRFHKRQSVFSAAGFLVIGAIVCYGLYMRLFCLYKDNNLEEKATKQAGYILDMPVKVVNTSVLRYRHQAKLFLSNKQSTE